MTRITKRSNGGKPVVTKRYGGTEIRQRKKKDEEEELGRNKSPQSKWKNIFLNRKKRRSSGTQSRQE